jgi:zinc protease
LSGRPGLTVRTRAVPGMPVIAVRLWLAGGARREALPGQSLVTGRALSEGTAARGWRQIADDAEALGAQLNSFGGFETYGVSIDALAADWERALEWAAELVLSPSFPEDRCAWVAKQASAELEGLRDQPEVETNLAFLEHLFTPHPRSRPLQGSGESLARITAEDCAAFHRGILPAGVLATVAGEIDEDAVRRRLEELFAGLPAAAASPPEPPAPVGMAEDRREVATHARDQVHLYLGQTTVPRNHPDFAALEVLSVILGGAGLSGRIPSRIRESEGLAYSAYAQATMGSGLDPGRLVAYVGTSLANAEKAEQGLREEFVRLLADGVTDEEMTEAMAYSLGSEPFQRETARQWADLLAEAERYRLPIDDTAWRMAEIAAVDRQAVEAAARRHIDPAKFKVTVGLPG